MGFELEQVAPLVGHHGHVGSPGGLDRLQEQEAGLLVRRDLPGGAVADGDVLHPLVGAELDHHLVADVGVQPHDAVGVVEDGAYARVGEAVAVGGLGEGWWDAGEQQGQSKDKKRRPSTRWSVLRDALRAPQGEEAG